MLARLLHDCGLDLGSESELMPAQADNPDGFWEHLSFVALNDEVLDMFGGAWDLPPRSDEDFSDVRLDPLRMKAKRLIEKFDSASVWGWKDPRNSLTLPFWKSVLPGLKTIVVVRNPLEVAYSMHERNGTSHSFGLRLWEIYNCRILETTTTAERFVTRYDFFFENPEVELGHIANFVGLPASEVCRAAAIAAPGKRHAHFTTEQLIDAHTSPAVVDLYRTLIAEADHGIRGVLTKSDSSTKRSKAREEALSASSKPIEFPIHEQPEISIIIPVFNQLSFTQACLASLQENQDAERFEVIVVDDGSDDATADVIGKIRGLVYLRNDSNSGFTSSCNRGAREARGSYLLFLNNDTAVTPGWLSALRETFENEPNAGLVGSKLVFPDGRLQEAGGIIWKDGSGWNRGKFDDPEKPEYNFLREVDYCSAACVMISKSLFERVGGFDLKYAPAYYEDTDLAFKIRREGFKVLYQPLSTVVHHEGATGGTDLQTGAKKYQEINRAIFASAWADVLAEKPASGDLGACDRLRPEQKRILVIDYQLPMPDWDSGSLRMFQMLKILHGLGHRVTFLPDNVANIPPYSAELQKRGIEVIYHPYVKNIGEYLMAHGPEFDVVVLSRCNIAGKHIANVRQHAPQSRIIFDTVDLHFLRDGREAELTQDASAKLIARDTQQQEYEIVDQADETWVVSSVEQELLRSARPQKSIEVVSNIVDVPGSRTPFSLRRDLLFIGNFLHRPNIDAVLFFIQEIYPLVKQRLSDAKFYVIGDKAPPEVVSLACENIIIIGWQSDVRPYFENVKLSVAPLRWGAGVKGKINQSMGFGVPVVGTSIAVEGMDLINREDVMVADEPDQFANALIELYESEELWNRLSQNAIVKTRDFYSVNAAHKQLRKLFDNQHLLSIPQGQKKAKLRELAT
jgi:GT2 family glycosyltransferase/glycosyltransferase involved in cell wall biosynthesis